MLKNVSPFRGGVKAQSFREKLEGVALLRRTSLQLLLGAGVAIAIHAFVALAWSSLYASSYWTGYANAAARGQVPHEFTSSPRAALHALVFFAVCGALAGALLPSVRALIVTWCGVWGGLLVLAALSPWAWRSNLAPLAVVAYVVYTAPFLAMGALAYFARSMLGRQAA